MNNKVISQLPVIIQTDTQKKFFDATFEQLFQKKSADEEIGWIGRKEGGRYDSQNDYFLSEETADRNNYQVEPIAYSKDPDTLDDTNVMFYDDFLNYIKQHNGLVNNHDRLFKTNSYSFAPPINADKFINYHNYLWLPNGLPLMTLDIDPSDLIGELQYIASTGILIQPVNDGSLSNVNTSTGTIDSGTSTFITDGVEADDLVIIDQTTYVIINVVSETQLLVDTSANPFVPTVSVEFRVVEPQIINLSSGMHLLLNDGNEYTVEGVGCGIYLVEKPNQILPFDQFEFLQWDNDSETWDELQWDAINVGLPYDYITMERGAIDNNAWSRTNSWYHKTVVFDVLEFLEEAVSKYVVASRPIIEFKRDILFYDSGVQFKQYITYVISDYTFAEINGIANVNTYDGGNILQQNDTVLITTGDDAGLYEVTQLVPSVTLSPITSNDGDIIIALSGDIYNGYTYYDNAGTWTAAAVQKEGINQPPLFDIFDTEGTSLDDETKYTFPTYTGNEIFSYKVNEFSDTPDTELQFPLEYTGLGQVGDIVFEHDLESNRAYWSETLDEDPIEIAGYYYYKNSRTGEYKTTWEIDSTTNEADGESTIVIDENKQKVIDRYVINADGNNLFSISHITDDVVVKLNGTRLLTDEYSISGSDVTIVPTTSKDDVIEFYSYSDENKIAGSRGYYEIPDALENNPTNQKIIEYSLNDMYKHFVSIIENQDGFTGNALGLDNNYRDTCQDMSKGTYMLQTRDPLLLAMLSSSTTKLDIVPAMRFSAQEYTRYKNKFIKTATELSQIGTPTFDDIIERLINATEFDKSFAYSYMFAHGTMTEEIHPVSGTVYTLADQIDLTDGNALYVYVNGELQLVDIDYEITGTNPIEITFPAAPATDVTTQLYSNVEPAFIPATPSKLGMYGVYKPEIITDDSFDDPIQVIVGHDGSRTPVYASSVVNDLLLEFEKRIYNGIDAEFRGEYHPPLSPIDVREGEFRNTQYSREEYVSVYRQSFSKWSNDINASWQENETYDSLNWKTWNYNEDGLPGGWKGIYEYTYDTHRPHTHPWEMLGFTQQPTWWEGEYGTGPWIDVDPMWDDLALGIIRDGARQGVDIRYARDGMVPPTNGTGDLYTIDELNLAADPGAAGDEVWEIGDTGPVEAAWKTTELYPFAMAELLFLTRPAQFGARMWDTTDNARSTIAPKQHISAATDNRRPYSGMSVHGETISNNIVYRHGYQQFISDYMAFHNLDIKLDFGDKVRRLDSKLGHKMGGFTNPSTIETFLEGTAAESTTNGLLIPKENVYTAIHTSPSIDDYTYSGVVVMAQEDGSYRVFGYDILDLEFKVIPRNPTGRAVDVTIGQDNEPFRLFSVGTLYQVGDIVKYNGVFYSSKVEQTPSTFSDEAWLKLSKLPANGGVSVSYIKQGQAGTVDTVPYGTVFQTEQEVFDFLIGYGDYLESQGWEFEESDPTNYTLLNWLKSAKDYLFWVTNNWAPGNIIRLSPASRKPKLNLARGYAGDLKVKYNGVYSLLDEDGAAIESKNIIIDRDDNLITARGTNQDTTGVYLMRVYATETEHRVTFDNKTSFADVIFDPLLGVRQNRLRFIGIRTLGWTGKREAPGYVITDDDKLLPNFDTLVESIRRFHDTESRLDRQDVEDTARHLIGFESKPYLVDLDIRQDTQYQFYQGMIRQKGSPDSVSKILRSTNIVGDTGQSIEVFEEFALRLGKAGADCTTQQLDLVIDPTQIKTNPQLIDLHLINATTTGVVKEIISVNSPTVYTEVPGVDIQPKQIDLIPVGEAAWLNNLEWTGEIQIDVSPATPTTQNQFPAQHNGNYALIGQEFFDHATATVILGDDGRVDGFEVTYGGSGYTQEPDVYIPLVQWDPEANPEAWDTLPWDGGVDRGIAILQFEITEDSPYDDIITIDKDDTSKWLTKPTRGCDAKMLWNMEYSTPVFPTAGYLNTKDLDTLVFELDNLFGVDFSTINVVGVAKSINETWGVYKILANGTILTNDGATVTTSSPIHLAASNGAVEETEDAGYIIIKDTLYTFEGTGPYIIKDADGTLLSTDLGDAGDTVKVFANRRYATETLADADSTIVVGDYVWIDDDGTGLWEVLETTSIGSFVGSNVRTEEQRVKTKLIKNAFIYDNDTKDTLDIVNIYDPVKGFIPGVAERNIDIKSHTDPAKYTNSDDAYKINESLRFGKKDVGRTWLDLSSFRYIDYEQGDTRYRRDTWGEMVSGSDLAVYEWVESINPPSSYTDSGTPMSLTDYTIEQEYSPSADYYIDVYYFWVRNKTTTPTFRNNRNVSIASIEQLLKNPKAQGYIWFSPVDEDSFIVANAEHLLENNDASFQINYKTTEKDTNLHTEWYLMGEGNRNSTVKDIHWNKMVDSLVGYTDSISTADMPYIDNLPGSDLIGTDTSTDSSERLYQLAVPNPTLSIAEKYGTENRPRQSWFVDIQAARKVFVQSVNTLFENITVFDPADFSTYVTTNNYWTINESGNIELSEAVYTDYRLDELRGELRQILNAVKDQIFTGDDFVKLNTLFFAMINYVLSEQKDVDWVFKTTYITLNQEAIPLEQKSTLTNDPFESLLDYINEVKPYSTKIRDYKNAFKTSDQVNVTVDEWDTKNMKIVFNRTQCEDFIVGWDTRTWEGFFDNTLLANANETECAGHEIFVNADGFITPTVPWDILYFDEEEWDGDAPVQYYEAANAIPNSFLPGTPLYSTTGVALTESTDAGGFVTKILDLAVVPGIDYSLMGVYLNGSQLFNYYIYNDSLYIMQQLADDDNIDLYEVALPDGGYFLEPQTRSGNPQELVPLIMHEGIVMQVKTSGVTIPLAGTALAEYPVVPGFTEVRVDNTPRTDYSYTNSTQIEFTDDHTGLTVEIDYPEINYRTHVNMTGRITYERMCNQNITLVGDHSGDATTIEVNDVSMLPDATVANPSVAWIGPEKISYSGKDAANNLLTGIQRGERNTAGLGAVNYNSFDPTGTTNPPAPLRKNGTAIWVGGDSETIHDGHNSELIIYHKETPPAHGDIWADTKEVVLKEYNTTLVQPDWEIIDGTVSNLAPVSPANNDLWFNTYDNILYIWNGSNWVINSTAISFIGFSPMKWGEIITNNTWTDDTGSTIYSVDDTIVLSGTPLAVFLRDCP